MGKTAGNCQNVFGNSQLRKRRNYLHIGFGNLTTTNTFIAFWTHGMSKSHQVVALISVSVGAYKIST